MFECIVVKGTKIVTRTTNANKRNEKLAFKSNTAFRSCISKINNKLMYSAQDLDIVMLMYNYLEYSNNVFLPSGSLWNYFRDELNDANENNNAMPS